MKTLFVQPLITEKSLALSTDGTYQFVVPTWATKRSIATFVAEHFGVSVQEVRTAKLRGESVRFKQRAGARSTYKKATVRLTKGQAIKEFALPVESKQTPTAPDTQKEVSVVEPKTESTITVRSKSKKLGK